MSLQWPAILEEGGAKIDPKFSIGIPNVKHEEEEEEEEQQHDKTLAELVIDVPTENITSENVYDPADPKNSY